MLHNDYSGTGFIDGGRKQITAWLYRSLIKNKPYDQFTRELISPTLESEGFIKGIKWRGNVNASQVPELQFSQNVAQVFFGINMKCASCHDSFIDHWKLDDAYALAAIVADKPLKIHRCDKATGKLAAARFLWPELGASTPASPGPTARGIRPAGDASRQRPLHPHHRQPSLATIFRPRHRASRRCDGEQAMVRGFAGLSRRLPRRSKIRSEEADGTHHDVQGVSIPNRPFGQGTRRAEYVFRGPELRRMSAEQFLDAVWMITHTGPAKVFAPIGAQPFAESIPQERRLIRAALVKSDELMRSLGRPNREQVVTTRPDQLTTLQALDLSNGHILADTFGRGANHLLKQQAREQRGLERHRLPACLVSSADRG